MANPSVITSGGSEVFYESKLMDGCDIYFAENANYPYKALIFETKKEATDFSGVLESHYHPSVCAVLPMEEVLVETERGQKCIYILPCEKAGRSLMDVITPQNASQSFYDGQSLTSFARKLLIDLFTVICNFIGTPVDVSLYPDNIFLVDNQWTVCLSKRTEVGTWADYKKMRHLTSFILSEAGQHRELRRFHDLISTATMRVIREIYKDPIFWTKQERMDFPTILWDSYEHSRMDLVTFKNNGEIDSPFGDRTLEDVYQSPRLKPWYHATVGFASPSIAYPDDASIVGDFKVKNRRARRLLGFARNCGAHFEQNIRRVPELQQETEEGLLNTLEEFFPNFIYKLHQVGVRLEVHRGRSFGMPEQSCLKDLVSDDDYLS